MCSFLNNVRVPILLQHPGFGGCYALILALLGQHGPRHYKTLKSRHFCHFWGQKWPSSYSVRAGAYSIATPCIFDLLYGGPRNLLFGPTLELLQCSRISHKFPPELVRKEALANLRGSSPKSSLTTLRAEIITLVLQKQSRVLGAKNRTQTCFSQTFRALPGYPGKIPGYPAKKFDFLGFERYIELFGPHPFTWKTPTPPEFPGPENIRTQKFGFVLFFRAWSVSVFLS